mmetsp:Transcript_21821/g.24360  ORF Transcript_21821/g.24360 Transcript_21821/m.24360 type:complete len:174 (-) Transcript_21821:92-613(-)
MSSKGSAQKRKKTRDEHDNEILDKVTREQKPTTLAWIFYFFNAIWTAALPVYLYVVIYGLDYVFWAPVLAFGTLGAALAMSFSYHNVFYSVNSRLNLIRGVHFKQGPKSESLKLNTNRESTSFAILYNNLLFLSAVILLGFYVLNTLPTQFNYIGTIAAASALVTWNSQQSTN